MSVKECMADSRSDVTRIQAFLRGKTVLEKADNKKGDSSINVRSSMGNLRNRLSAHEWMQVSVTIAFSNILLRLLFFPKWTR